MVEVVPDVDGTRKSDGEMNNGLDVNPGPDVAESVRLSVTFAQSSELQRFRVENIKDPIDFFVKHLVLYNPFYTLSNYL